jgi:glycosyltransferase involved in cell wall biosynthesis
MRMSFLSIDGSTARAAGALGSCNAHTASRRHVLFVTPYLPSPPKFGGMRRIHALASGLARICDVSMLSLASESGEACDRSVAETRRYCRYVQLVPSERHMAGGVRKRVLQTASMVSPWSYEYLAYRRRDFAAALRSLVSRERFDVVQFEFTQMAVYRDGCGSAARAPAVCLDEHNVEYDLVRRAGGPRAGLVRRAYSAVDWRKLRREERRAWSTFDGCALTSRRDEEMLLEDQPRACTAVVPNGVDIELFAPRPRPGLVDPNSLLFFGSLDYHPNDDGLRFFLGEVFPRLRARRPAARLVVVGRRPPAWLLERANDAIEVVGEVDDVRQPLERAAVVVVPLRMGGGTRLKILEAMAMARPIVSTSIGAEGLEVMDGRELLLADDADGFAALVDGVLSSEARSVQLGEAARKLVVDRYAWSASVSKLEALHERILQSRGRRG